MSANSGEDQIDCPEQAIAPVTKIACWFYEVEKAETLSEERVDTLQRVVALHCGNILKLIGTGDFTLPLTYKYNERALIDLLVRPFIYGGGKEAAPAASAIVARNAHDAMCILGKDDLIMPNEYPDAYKLHIFIRDTPFTELLKLDAKLDIPHETYFEHTHIVGGTGSGKTSFLAQLVLRHINDPKRPSVVIVDSQGSLIPHVSTLKQIQDRVIYIDPTDPPAISVFEGAGALQVFHYLFTSLGITLTGKQAVFFQFLTQLMMEIPGATMQDLINVTVDQKPYQEHINKLSVVAQDFFNRDFSKTFKTTREEVRYRLQGIMGNDKLAKLLGSDHTDLNIGEALDSGKIILVDTSRKVLPGVFSTFGRIFIFFILRALYDRAPIPEKLRHPVHLLIDEAQEYFDQNVNDLLNQMRKFKCGCVFAHHNLQQTTPDLRSSLAASTSIKLASQLAPEDARPLAQQLRTTPEFLMKQPPLHFAIYVRGETKRAISFKVTPGVLDKEVHVERKRVEKNIAEHKELPQNNVQDSDTSASDKW